MQETCTLRIYLSSKLPASTILTRGCQKFICCKCVEIPLYLHAISLSQNKAHLKTFIKKLEGELREQEERFTEVSNPDYVAFTKTEGSMKNHMEELGGNNMKNLLNELQDSKREMEEKLNHVMIQTNSYTKSVQNTSQEKNQTPNGTYIDFCAIMEETKNAELFEKKRSNSVPRTSSKTISMTISIAL